MLQCSDQLYAILFERQAADCNSMLFLLRLRAQWESHLQHTLQLRAETPCDAGGDEWLERKGRRNVPGPEQRRGRKNLFETFQMSSDPFKDHRTLDDIFLERKGKKWLPTCAGANMYGILQDQQIDIAAAPAEVKRYYISELVPVGGSLTTRTVPSLTKQVPALA